MGWTEGASRTHGERGARAGVWGQSLQRGPGAKPLVRSSGGKANPEAESILPSDHPNEGQNLPLHLGIFETPSKP